MNTNTQNIPKIEENHKLRDANIKCSEAYHDYVLDQVTIHNNSRSIDEKWCGVNEINVMDILHREAIIEKNLKNMSVEAPTTFYSRVKDSISRKKTAHVPPEALLEITRKYYQKALQDSNEIDEYRTEDDKIKGHNIKYPLQFLDVVSMVKDQVAYIESIKKNNEILEKIPSGQDITVYLRYQIKKQKEEEAEENRIEYDKRWEEDVKKEALDQEKHDQFMEKYGDIDAIIKKNNWIDMGEYYDFKKQASSMFGAVFITKKETKKEYTITVFKIISLTETKEGYSQESIGCIRQLLGEMSYSISAREDISHIGAIGAGGWGMTDSYEVTYEIAYINTNNQGDI